VALWELSLCQVYRRRSGTPHSLSHPTFRSIRQYPCFIFWPSQVNISDHT